MSDAVANLVGTILVASITSAMTLLVAYFIQRPKARAEGRKSDAEGRQSDAGATESLQRVIASMGDTYLELVEHVRKSVESQIEAKYQSELEDLRARVVTMETEREEWQVGIGLLMAQLVIRNIEPEWRPGGRDGTREQIILLKRTVEGLEKDNEGLTELVGQLTNALRRARESKSNEEEGAQQSP